MVRAKRVVTGASRGIGQADRRGVAKQGGVVWHGDHRRGAETIKARA